MMEKISGLKKREPYFLRESRRKKAKTILNLNNIKIPEKHTTILEMKFTAIIENRTLV